MAARLKPRFEEEARQRQRPALKQGSEFPVRENSPRRGKHEENGPSAQKAAVLMKVCRSSVKAADKVKKQGVPQRVDALAAGKVSVRSENLPQRNLVATLGSPHSRKKTRHGSRTFRAGVEPGAAAAPGRHSGFPKIQCC